MRQPKILTTIRDYSWSLFAADLAAGATVAMVALPLSLAIAIASGADPAKGLVTAIVAGFFISLLGGSRVQIGGPTGAFIVVVFGVIAKHGYDGLVLATLMAGVVLLIAGFLRAGRLIALVPEAVVNGFTIGIAIVIATSQAADFLGLSVTKVPADFIEKIPVLWEARESFSLPAFAVALVTLVLIVALRRMAPRFPGLIVAVALGSAIVADRMIEGHHRPNAELTAQGAANIASAFFGGLPATGAIARTATNVRAGGKTPVAGIVHALVILIVMLVAAPLAGYLAMPALAALLVITAWNMSEPHKWGEYARTRVSDRVLLVLTLVLTVLVDLTVAIGVGVSIGLALRLYRRSEVQSDWTPPDR